MSELRQNSRLENFEANKAEAERKKVEEALYGEAGTTDFSDDAKTRIEEADRYERHMESLADETRSDYDRGLDRLESGESESAAYNQEWDDAIAQNEAFDAAKQAEKDRGVAEVEALKAKFAENASLRMMDRISAEIGRLRNKEVDEDTVAADEARLKELEDRLNELLLKYEASDDYDPAIADMLMDRDDSDALDRAAASALKEREAKGESHRSVDEILNLINKDPAKAKELGLVDELRKLLKEVEAKLKAGDHDDDDDALRILEGLEAPEVDHDDTDKDEDEDSLAALGDLEAPDVAEGDEAHDDSALDAPEVLEGEDDSESDADADPLDAPVVVLTPSDLEGLTDEAAPARKPSLLQRARNRVNVIFYRGLNAVGDFLHSSEKKNTRRGVALGAVAVLAAGTFVAFRYGLHFGGGSGNGSDTVNNLPTGNKPTTGGGDWNNLPSAPTKAPELYPLNAHVVNPGEGWYEAMSRAGIKDSGVQHQILQNDGVMQRLHDMGLAYKAPELGGWGLNMPADGKMPDAALDILTNAAK